MNFQFFCVVALCLVGYVAANPIEIETEESELSKLFEPDAAPLSPHETLNVLKHLASIYENSKTPEDESEQSRRFVVTSSIPFADAYDFNYCTQERFNDLQYYKHYFAPYPNMFLFIGNCEAEQLAFCKEVVPEFSPEYTDIDELIADDEDEGKN